jgi:NADH oxidase (H2O2-forming)
MITALAHRGIETHVIDPNPWALGELADPDIVELAQESWAELGVTMHWNTSLQEFLGNESGAVRGVRTSNGDIECDLVVVATHKVPNSELAVAAGLNWQHRWTYRRWRHADLSRRGLGKW